MSKMKIRKSILKRLKITSKGKLLRRHQLGVGTHRHTKTKGALGRHKKTVEFFKGEAKSLRKVIGL
jgi:ribosomal protein L35